MSDNKFKEAEAILYDYKNISGKMNILKLKLDKINNAKTEELLSAVDYSRDSISPTNAFSSSVENVVVKKSEIEDNINELKYRKELVESVLDILDDTDRNLIEYRYFSKPKKSWYEVAAKMGMTVDNCIKKRRTIIDNIKIYLT